jgi:hypothetical protein
MRAIKTPEPERVKCANCGYQHIPFLKNGKGQKINQGLMRHGPEWVHMDPNLCEYLKNDKDLAAQIEKAGYGNGNGISQVPESVPTDVQQG